jgi:hypothetical protein
MPTETTRSDFAGACLCGGVQWTSSENPALQFNCYCVDCRKSTGAAFVPIMFFKAESMRIIGDLTRFSSQGGTGHVMHRAFCPRCGAQVVAEVALMPGLTAIRAGTLTDVNLFKPKASIFVSQASHWAPPRDDLPRSSAFRQVGQRPPRGRTLD